MPVPIEQLAKQIEDSGILDGETLKDFLPPKSNPKDGEELARELVRKKKLTKYQAEELYKGKGKSLVLGNYEIQEKLGAGGMGQVFRAKHRRMQRIVAIKLLPPTLMKDPAVVARFEREVTAAAKLNHPNIVTAFDADKVNDAHFLVMECVEGSDLAALVRKNGPFPVDQAVNYILQTARGLEAAHAEGIVHRDIKPANLLLDKKGTVKILDMGLARIGGNAAGADLTSTGAIMGTIDYMAPEQAVNTKAADTRADIYSLGCSLYYLLAGKAAYDGDTLMSKLLAHRDQPIPSLRDVCPGAPAQLETIFTKMVAKRVDDRYQTISDVIADLMRLTGGQAASANPQPSSGSFSDAGLSDFLKDVSLAPAGPVRSQRTAFDKAWITRNRQILQIGGGVLGALVLVAGLILTFKSKGNTPSATRNETVTSGKKAIRAKSEPVMTPTNDDVASLREPVDLLKLVDLERDVVSGEWLWNGKTLTSPAKPMWARLQIPFQPPSEYELTAVIERLGGNTSAHLGIVVDGRQGMIVLDGIDVTGLDLTDELFNANSTTYAGKLLPSGKQVSLSVRIRPRSVTMTCDGKQIFDWYGDPSRLFVRKETQVPDPKKLFVGIFDQRFRFHELRISPLSKSAPNSAEAPVGVDDLQGNWIADGVEQVNGSPMPAISEKRFVFAGRKLTMTRKNNGVFGYYEGTFSIGPSNHFDFAGTDTVGKPVAWRGIFKLERDSLALCYKYVKDAGTQRPTEFKTDDKAGTPFVMIRLRRDSAGTPGKFPPKDAAVFEGHAYKFFQEVMTWHEAKSRCEQMGGHLPIVTSTAEDAFLMQLAKKGIAQPGNHGVWLGGTDEHKEGDWRWIDGKAFEFKEWGPRQPNNKGNKEHFLMLYLPGGNWSDQPDKSVEHTVYFICEWDTVR